ncbi:murein hydrolase activator EnvC family protein [Pseudoxanthomonas indica]|uniref:Septal ring factor EnvC, activator of murein hydrolases AmiA and AmiB n=1 Tax=Pseudoxanthomonas indica TaxID=428993 RepID=A0A1T5KUB6_9GAMM|nr:peptidoglycan DD-metalloendopeptidase family protein [Pseudoxanthomonas indica]GGD51639.1 peptidase M23 [Pseudoxanthomonas indica]SKC67240.1 Septal ring factor EnvC, activator of murein hydrolases AmiA and AmiB [Pseudoxanthomonas indica]
MSLRRARLLMLGLLVAATAAASAQSQRDAQKQLEKVRGELKSIAKERRKLEGERGDASRKLRDADEQVGKSSRGLSETEASLRREEAALAELQQQRLAKQQQLRGQREVLASLVRAAYANGEDAPLKVLLSQDHIADASRTLAYHRYLQRDRAQRISQVTADLQSLDQLEQEIGQRRVQLDGERSRQRAQVSQLQKDRQASARLVAELDERYQDRAEREKALGQDARSLERLLANLRAAAARAEAERKAAARRAAQEEARAAKARTSAGRTQSGRAPVPASPKTNVANAPALKVGGLGWPVSGNLLARYGGRMPDGRTSAGVLIGAPAGSTVTAVADGTVVFSEWMTGYGLILIIDHGNGYMSLYAHNESLLRDTGVQVKRGEAVAKVGTSGGQGTPALYFELRRNGQPVDPSSWLQRR